MEINLLQQIKNGDDEAFEEIYKRYGEYALRVAFAITGNEANAADAVQETFIRVYNHRDKIDINRPFKPWFYKILVNECKRSIKKSRPGVPISDILENHPLFIEEDNYSFEEYEILYNAIENLKDIHRIPIILKYLKGFKEVEIAEILGVNHNTIKSRLLKGRRELKLSLNHSDERREING